MRSMYRVYLAMAVVCCCGVMAFAAGVPNTLNYQGTLTSGTGTPVTATKPMLFKMYTSATGGSAFWTEQQSVNVKNGNFSVVFGSNAANAIPTAKFNGTTYIGVTVDPPAPEMLPRQKLTSVAYALKAADAIPKGVIVMWSGSVGQIPEGWALCDGVVRTLPDGSRVTPPNLKDKFIIGTGDRFGSGKVKGLSGGEEDHLLTIDEIPSHDHSASSGGHNSDHSHSGQTGGQTADHSHTLGVNLTGATSGGSSEMNHDGGGYRTSGASNDHAHYFTTGGASNDHNHTVTVNAKGGSLVHNNLPPYYALAFIMKL